MTKELILFYSVLSGFDDIGIKFSNEPENHSYQKLELSSFACKISPILYFYVNVVLIITLKALCPRLIYHLLYKNSNTIYVLINQKANILLILMLQ